MTRRPTPSEPPTVEPQVERRTCARKRPVRRALVAPRRWRWSWPVVATVARLARHARSRSHSALRALAERQGTSYLKRPLHIGGISALPRARSLCPARCRDRGQAPRRPARSWRRSHRRRRALVDDLPAGAPRERHARRLGHGRRVAGPTACTTFRAHAAESRNVRRAPFTTTVDFALRAGRPLHLRRPRDAVVGRCAQSRASASCGPPASSSTSARPALLRRHGARSKQLPADGHGDVHAVRPRRPACPAASTSIWRPTAPCRTSTATSISARGRRRRRSTTSTPRSSFRTMKDIFFTRESWRLGGRGRVHGHLQAVPGRARPDAARSQPDRAIVNDLAFRQSARLADLDADALCRHARRDGFVGRPRPIRLLARAARHADRRDGDVRGRLRRTSISSISIGS